MYSHTYKANMTIFAPDVCYSAHRQRDEQITNTCKLLAYIRYLYIMYCHAL